MSNKSRPLFLTYLLLFAFAFQGPHLAEGLLVGLFDEDDNGDHAQCLSDTEAFDDFNIALAQRFSIVEGAECKDSFTETESVITVCDFNSLTATTLELCEPSGGLLYTLDITRVCDWSDFWGKQMFHIHTTINTYVCFAKNCDVPNLGKMIEGTMRSEQDEDEPVTCTYSLESNKIKSKNHQQPFKKLLRTQSDKF